jgi:3-methyladenine DNA glycosylase AlkC
MTGAPLLKDILGPAALLSIADAATSPLFDRATFLRAAGDGLAALSIMERVRHIADALHQALPVPYRDALAVVRAMAPGVTHGFQAVALADYVARHGLHDIAASTEALADLTRFGSAEFAVRPFLARDPERMLAIMLGWADDPDDHVRRLASEGARPRLPWAARVPALKADPTFATPILERLKGDPSAYVRKSVANHLNDITRENPLWVLDRLEQWPQDDPHTRWIIRHALRTLIKQGEPRALALIGASGEALVDVSGLSLAPATLHLGDRLTIAVDLVSTATAPQRLVVDYRVHYARPGGKTAAKVFKLKTLDLAPGAHLRLAIDQTIRDFSTRKHHAGRHRVEIIVNGQTRAEGAFEILP